MESNFAPISEKLMYEENNSKLESEKH
jgi:hypothetical protein